MNGVGELACERERTDESQVDDFSNDGGCYFVLTNGTKLLKCSNEFLNLFTNQTHANFKMIVVK